MDTENGFGVHDLGFVVFLLPPQDVKILSELVLLLLFKAQQFICGQHLAVF